MFKVKVILKVCPDDIFRMIYAVETKCSIAVHNQCGFIKLKYDSFYCMFRTVDLLATKLSLMVHQVGLL